MKANYNQGFPKYAKLAAEQSLEKAETFLKLRYPDFDFSDIEIQFSTTRHGSNYKHLTKRINIRCGHTLYLYRKAGCKLTTPPEGLCVGSILQTTCAIIHELTHYVQGSEKRKFSEVETTQNEIDYLKLADDFWYNKLIPSK